MVSLFTKLLGQPAGVAFLPYLNNRMAAMENGQRLTKRGVRFSPHSPGGYASLLKYLRHYATQVGSPRCDQMDEAWFNGFQQFLLASNLRHNSICSIIRKAKGLVQEQCRLERRPFLAQEVGMQPEETIKVYHPIAELTQLCAINLHPKLALRRDAYLIQAYTGLRYSDLRRVLADARLYTQEVAGKYYFRLYQQKTGGEVTIPLSSMVLNLLDRHHWQLPLPSIQWYNRAIKKAAQAAGLTQQIVVSYTQHGTLHRQVVEKWSLISSHTARRSFATNAYLAGISCLKIRQITGHRTEAAFMAYIRADSLELALTLIEHPFFA